MGWLLFTTNLEVFLLGRPFGCYSRHGTAAQGPSVCELSPPDKVQSFQRAAYEIHSCNKGVIILYTNPNDALFIRENPQNYHALEMFHPKNR